MSLTFKINLKIFPSPSCSVQFSLTLSSSLDSKEIQPVHPKGNQSLIFFGKTNVEAETPLLWPPDVKN